MITVDSITIKEFRGIRDLTLDLKNKNYAICGPNGTGKSGVVDALEFALTGTISRLSGAGKGEVSVKEHGPHVDFRDNPDKARVSVKVTIPSLQKTATIERSVKAPGKPAVTPSAPDVLNVLIAVAQRPEFVLSRRELIRYVLAPPGDRAQEVQALLHLEAIEEVRQNLQKIANASERQLPLLKTNVTAATDNLLKALGVTEVSVEKILIASNQQRAVLGLPAMAEMTTTTNLKDGLSTPAQAKPQKIPKAQATVDLGAAKEALLAVIKPEFVAKVAVATEEIQAIADGPAVKTGLAVENFYKSGLTLVEDEICPLCDTEWNIEELRAKIQGKLTAMKQFTQQRKLVEGKLAPIITGLAHVGASLQTIVRYGALANPQVVMGKVQEHLDAQHESAAKLREFMPLSDSLDALAQIGPAPEEVEAEIVALEAVVNALPDSNKQDAARDFLTVAQERLEAWREAKRKHKAAAEEATRARLVYDTFVNAKDTLLTGMYAAVEKDFSALYRQINQADEAKFSAKIEPSLGKLGFDVDFYGRGFFPPGAYHSEGHQDGMGLCLYLALMRHLYGDKFNLAVLDDVLMSVDTGHRREVCALLKKDFPNTQFVVTTHDEVWLRHMKTAGMVTGKSSVQFRKWSVDQGPTEWLDKDVWAEIEDYLAKNDVRSAAALLRHFLEYTAGELCHRLRVPVEYRYDGLYQLGELLPKAVAHYKKLLKDAKVIANEWNHKEAVAALSERNAAFGVLAQTCQVEQWQVNVAVHFNSWDNLKKEDFAPVLQAFRQLLASLQCETKDCSSYFFVAPNRESPESLRCECGKVMINLKKKG